MAHLTHTRSGDLLNFKSPRETKIKSLKVYFSPKQEGSGTPSPENVRPINGWNGVSVNICGKNLCPAATGDDMKLWEYNNANKRYVITNLPPNTPFTLSCTVTDTTETNSQKRLYLTGKTSIFINTAVEGVQKSITVNSTDEGSLTIAHNNSGLTSVGSYIKDVQLEIGSTVTEFEPYRTIKNRLPDEYQEVEYIESTGTQRMITDFCPNDKKYIFKMKIIPTDVPQDNTYFRVFGNLNQSNDNIYRFQTRINGTQYRFCPCFGTRAQSEQVVNQIYYLKNNNEYEIIIDGINQQYSVGDYSSKFSLPAGNANETPIAIFASGPVAGGTSAFKLYYFNAEDQESQKVINLIPCYRKSDGEIGMYDLVSDTFYTNSGTGTFLKGDDIGRTDIDWTDDVGTVYGGYVDLVNGELVETWDKIVLDGTESYSTQAENDNYYRKYMYVLPNYSLNNTAQRQGISDYLQASTSSIQLQKTGEPCIRFGWGDSYLYIMNMELIDDELATVQAFKDYLTENPLTVVYPISTPNTYQLTPSQLHTLWNNNTFWSNADSIEIEYELAETEDIRKARKNVLMGAAPHKKTVTGSNVLFETNMTKKLNECKVYFSPTQEGTGNPSPSNVRPISGWDGITLKYVANNLYEYNASNKGYISSAGKITTDAVSTYSDLIPVEVGDTFIYHCMSEPYASGKTNRRIHAYNSSGTWVEQLAAVEVPTNVAARAVDIEFTIPSGIAYVRISVRINDTETYLRKMTQYDVQFPKTIYGGYVDLVNGIIVESDLLFNIDENSTPIYTIYRPSVYRIDYSLPQTGADKNLLMWSHGTIKARNTASYNYPNHDQACCLSHTGLTTYVSIGATHQITTKEEWDEWLAQNQPLQFCYELATPNTYSITPQIINASKGDNFIYSNSNGNIEVKYWTR